MKTRLRASLRWLASGLMLLAAIAFVHQSAVIIVSEAAASAGVMPHPAVTLSGPVHFHDDIVRQVHAHRGHNAPGHVHGTGDPDHHETDESNGLPMWSLYCASAVVPILALCSVPIDVVGAVEAISNDRLVGIEPDGLNRPPSTPSIA